MQCPDLPSSPRGELSRADRVPQNRFEQQQNVNGFRFDSPPAHTREEQAATPNPFDNDDMLDPANFFGPQIPDAENQLESIENLDNEFQLDAALFFNDGFAGEQLNEASVAVSISPLSFPESDEKLTNVKGTPDHSPNRQIVDNQQQEIAPVEVSTSQFVASQYIEKLTIPRTLLITPPTIRSWTTSSSRLPLFK